MKVNNIEPIRVGVRCRPLLPKEIQSQRKSIVKVDESLGEISVTNPPSSEDHKNFAFDHVFGPEASQSTIYNEIAFPLVNSVLQGYNGTIFAYGQTCAGKTHTMQGKIDSDELKGIIPRALEQIFNYSESTPGKQFSVRVSFCELYNEQAYDLLAKNRKDPLQIRESSDIGVYVQGLHLLPVKNVADACQKLVLGNQNRIIRPNQMSSVSTRSHTIFSVTVDSSEPGPDGKTHFKRGKLNLVGLAGSEKVQKSGAAGLMLQESLSINQSLSSLRKVITALADPKSRHVPFRDSKLTRLLQESLGGNAKTVMIANIEPADVSYDEVISTLKLASRAKSVMNKPIINEELRDSEGEIEESKAQSNELPGEVGLVKEGEEEDKEQDPEENKVVIEQKVELEEKSPKIDQPSGEVEQIKTDI